MNRNLAILLGLGAIATNANATGLFLDASDFSVFTRNNFTASNSDVEGRVFVGGNLNVQNYSFGEKMTGFTGRTLVVNGDFKYTNGQVFNGNVRTQDTTPTTSGFAVPKGSLTTGFSGLGHQELGVELIKRSGFVATQATNGTVTSQFGQLTLSGGSGTTRVFNISADQLASANTFTINLPSGTTAVVNVSGQNASFKNAGFNLQGGIDKSKVLLNFAQAKTLEMSGIGLNANILAPQADFKFNNGLITGQIAVQSFTGGGQVNLGKFNGTTPVPEPASMAALVIGGIGLLRKRRLTK